jgi:hypothetical protein
VGVEFYLTGTFDWLPEFIVFGLGASGEQQFAGVLQATPQAVTLQMRTRVEAAHI